MCYSHRMTLMDFEVATMRDLELSPPYVPPIPTPWIAPKPAVIEARWLKAKAFMEEMLATAKREKAVITYMGEVIQPENIVFRDHWLRVEKPVMPANRVANGGFTLWQMFDNEPHAEFVKEMKRRFQVLKPVKW